MDVNHLKPNSFYIFDHSGKGRVVAKFIGYHRNPDDEADPLMVEVAVWTGPGSGQEHFANSMAYAGARKLPPLFSSKILRPSQITDINAPSTAEQDRLQKSTEHSAKHDYTPSADMTPYRPVTPVAPITSVGAPVPQSSVNRYALAGAALALGAGAGAAIALIIGG